MKIKFIISLFLMFFGFNLYSQNLPWSQLNSGTNFWLRTVYFINPNTGFAAGDYGIILRTTNAGQNWISQTWPNIYALYSISFRQNQGKIVGYENQAGAIMKTSNYGLNWVHSAMSWGEGSSVFNSISYIDTSICFIGGYFLSNVDYNYHPIFVKHFDWNDSFHLILPNIISQTRSLSFANSSKVFCVNGPPGNILSSIDGGYTWSNSQWSVPLTSIFFVNSNTGFIAGYNGNIFKTSTGGISWIQNIVSPTNNLNSVFFIQQGSGYRGCVVGEGGIIMISVNSGMTWLTSNSNTFTNLSAVFFIDSLTGYAVGQNGIILKTTTGGLTGFEKQNEKIPVLFSLSQNYPNPFNSSTTIEYSLPHNSFVSLKIYDALGKEIEMLVNEYKNPGTYKINFDGTKLSSGVYFYKIATSDLSGRNKNFNIIKKMIVIK